MEDGDVHHPSTCTMLAAKGKQRPYVNLQKVAADAHVWDLCGRALLQIFRAELKWVCLYLLRGLENRGEHKGVPNCGTFHHTRLFFDYCV